MSTGFVLVLTFAIGLVSGLRTFTGAAAVTWAAHLGWINLSGSPLAFMGSMWALGIFTILALVEYVTDQLPSTPARTVPMQLGARLVLGILAGVCLGAAAGVVAAGGSRSAPQLECSWEPLVATRRASDLSAR